MKPRRVKPICLWSLIAATIAGTFVLWRWAEAPSGPLMNTPSDQFGLCDRWWSLHNLSCDGRLILQLLWRGTWNCPKWRPTSPRPDCGIAAQTSHTDYDPRFEILFHVDFIFAPSYPPPLVHATSRQTTIVDPLDGGCASMSGTCMESYWAPVRAWTVSCVSWLPFALSLAFATLVGGRTYYRYRRRRSSRLHGHCVKCGYDLTGNLSGRCPECGTPVPPAAAVEPRTGK